MGGLRAAAVAMLVWLAGVATLHAQPAAAPAQQFIADPPGTYALPAIQAAADGWVLDGNWLPRRLSRYTHGALTLLSFVYTYCTDPIGCPLAYATFEAIQRRVAADASLRGQVRLVSLSFDPTNDTPAAMRAYGGEHARSVEVPWRFLTTWSMGALAPILEGFGQDVEIERDDRGAPTRARTHLLKVFLLDRQGQVREIYTTAFLHVDVIFNDIKTLALEGRPPAAARPAAGGAASGDAFGLPPRRLPAGVATDARRVALGRKLFFDRRLSFNGTMSCAMCHVPEQGFASNASRTGVGMQGRSLRRNAPSLLNVAWQSSLLHDGRAGSLVDQVWLPLLHPDEMANASADGVLERIAALDDYRERFEQVFGGAGVSVRTVGEAIAAFEATLVAADSRFDRWRYGGSADALSDTERLGYRIFVGRGRCASCHLIGTEHALLSDGRFHVTGAGAAAQPARSFVVPLAPGVQTVVTDAQLAAFAPAVPIDLGRFEVTRDPADRFAFKTPSLRNVARSAPYMHDGSLPTLDAVVDFYDRGGGRVPGKSALLAPLGLSDRDKQALVAFLRALDGVDVDRVASRVRRADDASPLRPGVASGTSSSN